MTTEASGTPGSGMKIKYLPMMVCGEALRQFDMLSDELGSATQVWVPTFSIRAMSKQKRAIRHGIRKPRSLKVRCYAARLIGLEEYLTMLPGANIRENNCVTELNGFLLNIMTNRWIKKTYLKIFDY